MVVLLSLPSTTFLTLALLKCIYLSMVFNGSIYFCSSSGSVMIVIDTNVYVSNLNRIKEILEDKIFAKDVKIFLPWTVLRELDTLKSRRMTPELAQTAQLAISFINRHLKTNPSRVRQAILSFLLLDKTLKKDKYVTFSRSWVKQPKKNSVP